MYRLRCARTLLAVAVTLVLADAALAEDNVYPKIIRSAAWVVTPDKTGSGVVVDREKRLIATNYHVIGNQTDVKVVFPSFQEGEVVAERSHYSSNLEQLAIKGTVIRSDPRRDLVLVQLAHLPDDVAATKLASRAAGPGQRIHSIGNPGASDALWVYSAGTVRQVYEKRFGLDGVLIEARVVETQTPINSGDSGGPVVNDEGELIGIVSGMNRQASLLSICIDVSELRGLLAGEIKTIDRLVGANLDRASLKYTVTTLGRYRLAFNMGDNSTQIVMVESQTKLLGKTRLREIWAVAMPLDRPLTAEQALGRLVDNRSRVIGAWEIRREAGKEYLVFCARVPAALAAADLNTTVRIVMWHTYQTRKNFSAATATPVAQAPNPRVVAPPASQPAGVIGQPATKGSGSGPRSRTRGSRGSSTSAQLEGE